MKDKQKEQQSLDKMVEQAKVKIDSLTVDQLQQLFNKYGYYPVRKQK